MVLSSHWKYCLCQELMHCAVVSQELDIGAIVSQRLTAMRKLQENPNDVQAISEMYRAQKDVSMTDNMHNLQLAEVNKLFHNGASDKCWRLLCSEANSKMCRVACRCRCGLNRSSSRVSSQVPQVLECSQLQSLRLATKRGPRRYTRPWGLLRFVCSGISSFMVSVCNSAKRAGQV